MKLKQLLLKKREEILKIAAKHGAYNVRIFGSVAREEEDKNSDIDFLIDNLKTANIIKLNFV